MTAVVLDPNITAVQRRSGPGARSHGPAESTACGSARIPPLREEYTSLGVWLQPVEHRRLPCTGSTTDGGVDTSGGLVSDCGTQGGASGASPGPRWMETLRRALEHAEIPAVASESSGQDERVLGPAALVELLEQLGAWLSSPAADVSAAARRAFSDADLHSLLVGVLRRAGTSSLGGTPGGVTGWGDECQHRGLPLAAISQVARVIGLLSWRCSDDAAAFTRVRVVGALCAVMGRFVADADVQLHAIFALRVLLEENPDTVCEEAMREDAAQRLRSVSVAHPQQHALQREVQRTCQLLAPCRPEPLGGSDRRGIASALMERRAAEAARPNVVTSTWGWLFSGGGGGDQATGPGGTASARGPRQSTSEPPGTRRRTSTPYMSPLASLGATSGRNPFLENGMPRLDLRLIGQGGDPKPSPEKGSVMSMGLSPAAPTSAVRRANSRPMAASSASRDDNSPHTPPAVRLQQREEAFRELSTFTPSARASVQ